MIRADRIALVVVGLAVAVYGVGSLTGDRPPWWERRKPLPDDYITSGFGVWPQRDLEPVPGREWISGGVVAAGVGLAAFGAWPRRRRPPATP